MGEVGSNLRLRRQTKTYIITSPMYQGRRWELRWRKGELRDVRLLGVWARPFIALWSPAWRGLCSSLIPAMLFCPWIGHWSHQGGLSDLLRLSGWCWKCMCDEVGAWRWDWVKRERVIPVTIHMSQLIWTAPWGLRVKKERVCVTSSSSQDLNLAKQALLRKWKLSFLFGA